MREISNPSETLSYSRRSEHFECPGGIVQVIDIEPNELKTPVPVLIIPGWGETSQTFESSVSILTDSHRRVLIIDQPRWGPIQSPEGKNAESYTKYEYTKALNVLEVLKKLGIEKADVIGHSEGGIIAASAASLSPDQFRTFIPVAPGGMMGKESRADVASESIKTVIGFLKRIVSDPKARQYLINSATETIKTILKNPTRSMSEFIEARLKSDIHGMLQILHSKGVKIALIHGVNDPALPMEKMQSVAKRDQLDGFYSVKGDHFEIYAQPGNYMAIVDEILTTLEAKLKKESADRENAK